MTDTLIVLVPITAYAGKHDNHDWEYGTHIDPRDEAQGQAVIAMLDDPQDENEDE